jgi:nicotinate-nucleotide adenylyltransferase
MRTLWFGGSFNPIHHGHLICSRAVAEFAGFERVVLIPSRQPPHKSGDTSLASAEDRLAMCQLAIKGNDFFQVDDLEIDRPGPSYTIDTARELKARGFSEISWLIGADMANNLPRWHDPAGLLAEIKFILMARPGWNFDWTSLPAEMQALKGNVVEAPLLEISSTDIRKRLATKQSIQYTTPDAVIDYIRRRQLYQ